MLLTAYADPKPIRANQPFYIGYNKGMSTMVIVGTRWFTGVVGLIGCAGFLNAQQGQVQPPLEAYGKLPTVSQMVISPNGERIAYRNTNSDDEDYIVVHSLKTQKQINAFRVRRIDPEYLRFSGNDHLLLSVTKHIDSQRYTNSFDAGTTYAYDIAKNKVRPLVTLGEELSRDRLVYPAQSIGNIIAASNDGKQVFIGAYVGDSEEDAAPRYSVLKVKTSGKGTPKVVVSGNDDVVDYFLDADEKPLARIERNQSTNTHTARSYDGKRWQKIYQYKSDITTHHFLGLSADYQSLIFLRNDEDQLQYYGLSLADGNVNELADWNIENSIARMLYDEQQVVIGVQYAGLTPRYRMFEPQLDQRVQAVIAGLKGHAVFLESWSPDFEHLLLRVEGAQYAGDYILASAGEKLAWLASMRPAVTRESINTQHVMEVVARDGLEFSAILTVPNTTELTDLPTVMLPHGGPASHDALGFDFMAQALAARGYLVVQPQFRGSSGFTRELLTAGYGQWGRKMQDDLTDTLSLLVKEQLTDPKRVCIVGASYGGYAALAGAAFTPDLYQCALSIAGISHIPLMLKEDKKRYGRDHEVLRYLERSILDGDYDSAALKEISPYFYADKVKIPILLMHGEDDTIVDYKQSSMMYRALKKAGKDVELVKLKNEDHYLREGSTRLQALQTLVAFVDRHIGN